MQYMKLTSVEREESLRSLAAMNDFLDISFGALTFEETRLAGPDGGFSPVEQIWHLADLEREGFGERIRRLRAEHEPHLPDFDGARVAAEREYRSRSLEEGLRTFAAARLANIASLQTLPAEAWARSGTQEGLGAVSLCDMPALMRQHDEAHKAEIRDWQRARSRPAS